MVDNDLIRNKGIMSAAQTMWTIDFDSEQSLEIGKVQNQKFTGKCWIYAGLNLLRILANRKNSRTSIILSANYIAYYDKYEKSKYFFEKVIETMKLPSDNRLVEHLFKNPCPDAGQWAMFNNIIKKYGIVPQESMPDTYSALDTNQMNICLSTILRDSGCNIRKLNMKGASLEQINSEVETKMDEIRRILSLSLGEPPTEFQYGKMEKKYSPISYYKSEIGVDLDKYLCLINAPMLKVPMYKKYCIQNLNNMSEGKKIEYIKIDMDNLKLTTVEGVLYDEDDAKDTPWFYGEGDEYSNSNGYDISKMKNITEEEGMNKWDEYSNNIKGYTISFFSNYTPKKSKEDIDAGIYEEFIKNGEYNNYLTSDWEYGMPSQYAVLDIDGNGVDELIIYGNENEWGNTIVFTYKGDTQEIVPIQANLYDTGDTSRKTNVIWFCKNMEYSPQYHALAFTDSHYGVGNEDYLYYTINNDVFDIAFDVSAFTNYNTGDIRYSKGGINVERNDISESDYEAYINELKPIEWKKLP